MLHGNGDGLKFGNEASMDLNILSINHGIAKNPTVKLKVT